MPEQLPATSGQKKKKTTRRVKNLVCRGGVWYVRKKLANGRVIRISTHQTDRALAEIVARDILNKIDKGEVDNLIGKKKPLAIPFYDDYARDYLGVVSAHNAIPQNDTNNLARSIASWKGRRINTVTANDCLLHLLSLKSANFSQNTMAVECITIGAVFARAEKAGLVEHNPWRAKEVKERVPKKVSRERVLLISEQDAFLDGFLSTPASLTRRGWDYRRAAVVLVGAGLRSKELRGLVPSRHLDFANDEINLTKDIVKGGYRARTVPMFPEVKAALLEQLAAHGQKPTSIEPLFVVSARGLDMRTQIACARAEIDRVTPHDLRRTFGTRAAEANTPMSQLQKWMGHASLEVTGEFYVHLNQDASRRIAQQVAAGMSLPASSNVVALKQKEQ